MIGVGVFSAEDLYALEITDFNKGLVLARGILVIGPVRAGRAMIKLWLLVAQLC